MALNSEQKALISQHMKSLSYTRGSGLFPRPKREINPNNRYLIVSYGGTGAAALYAVRNLLREELHPEDYKSHVRFLCIDTDKDTRYESSSKATKSGAAATVRKERFSAGEFFWLDNGPARKMLEHNTDASVKEWANPFVVDDILSNPLHLDGSGAGSIRMHGRILLAAKENYDNLCAKLRTLIKELTDGNADSLKIIVLSGIAGGTGSGIVVDATYIIRSVLSGIHKSLPGRTKVDGFILLPPTGTSDEEPKIQSGNRNGIAALKEINHFMSIGKRGESYRQSFGGVTIESPMPIFDVCYLLDGQTNKVAEARPREKAIEVIKDCVLDMLTSLPVDGKDATEKNAQDVASRMSDTPAFAKNNIKSQSATVAPREAHYVYCAIGYGKMQIPIELMKAYVAKIVFDNMYAMFKQCENITEQDALAFLDEMGAPKAGLFEGASPVTPEQLKTNVNNAVVKGFQFDPKNPAKKGGPYFMINLINKAVEELRERINDMNGYALKSKDSKRSFAQQCNFIIKILNHHRDTLFDVYVEVLEQLKQELKSSSDILCSSKLMHTYQQSTYSFAPIDFGSTDPASRAVQAYLHKLISGARVRELCHDLLREMLDKRQEWTQMMSEAQSGQISRFAPAQRIRAFWSDKIGSIVNSTLQDYLVKYYAQDSTVEFKRVNGVVNPKGDAAMKKAAAELVKQMWGPAGAASPLAGLQTTLMTGQFNANRTILIPQSAPDLIDYVQDYLSQHSDKEMNQIMVLRSTVNSCISCYAQFTCIPGFMFTWAEDAEKDYEYAVSVGDHGLHMSETSGGNQWHNLPNIIPEIAWKKLQASYVPSREAKQNEVVRDIFNRALQMNLPILLNDAEAVQYYDIRHLPAEYIPGVQMFRDVDYQAADSEAWKEANTKLEAQVEAFAQAIFAKHDWIADGEPITKGAMASKVNALIPLKQKSLHFNDTVFSQPPNDAAKIENWEEYLAAALLRTSIEYTYIMRGTILVMEKLYDMIKAAQDANAAALKEKEAAETKLKRFCRYLVGDLFEYVEEDMTYYIVNGRGVQEPLYTISYGNELEEKVPLYFLHQAFVQRADELMPALDQQYYLVSPAVATTPIEGNKIKKALDDKKKAYLADITPMLTYNRADPTAGIMGITFAKLAEGYGHDVEDIRSFFSALQDKLNFFAAYMTPKDNE